jgi:DNA-directed RNA polymerase subunit RPC12/RpoP
MPPEKEIKCPQCGKDFNVATSRLQSGAIKCPHCGSRMDSQSVNDSILKLAAQIKDDFAKARKKG